MRFSFLRITAIALLLYSLWSLSVSFRRINSAEETVASLEVKLESLQDENRILVADIESVQSGEGMERLARERLGYVMPGERIFYFITDTDNR